VAGKPPRDDGPLGAPPRLASGSADPALAALYRVGVENVREVYLGFKRRPNYTALPTAAVRERAAVLLSQRLPVEAVEQASLRVALRARHEASGRRATPGAIAGFDDLAREVERLAADATVVGFDVFNTLMLRKVDGEWVKRAVAARLARDLRHLLHPSAVPSAEQVAQRRTELEQDVASEAVARGDDNEVDYEELLRRWVGSYVPNVSDRPAQIERVRATELRIEATVLRAAPGVSALLEKLKGGMGKRLIWVSDMYHRADTLWGLLENVGLARYFDEGYCSIDLGRRKATRRLFPRVLEKEGLRPNQLLFVGDDALADFESPRQLGIPAIRLLDVSDGWRRRRLRVVQQAAERNPFWRQRLVDEVLEASPEHVERTPDVTYQTGLTLAPGLVAFMLDVIERSRALGIKRLFFLAREGLTLLRVYHQLARHGDFDDGLPQARYLFLSRASTILPSMRDLSWEEVHRFWRQYSRQSLRALVRNLSLPADEFLPLGAACGLVDPDLPIEDPTTDPSFLRFLKSKAVHEAFVRHRDHTRNLLRRYLAYRGVFGEKAVGLIDIGWKGTMQDNVVRAFEGAKGFPEVHGFYLALTHDGSPAVPRSHKYGFLADTRRGDIEETELFRNTAIFEMTTTANHGSAVCYEATGRSTRRVLPVLRHHDLEKHNASRFFKRAQKAIVDYAHDFARMHAVFPFTAEELKPGALDRVLRYVRHPTADEADEFLRYSHVESFGVDQITTFGLDLGLRQLLKGRAPWTVWRRAREGFELNLWKEGVVRRSRVPFASLFYDAYYSLKRVR
jgi:FMN phosphatase YigB (HAD superfamily)